MCMYVGEVGNISHCEWLCVCGRGSKIGKQIENTL